MFNSHVLQLQLQQLRASEQLDLEYLPGLHQLLLKAVKLVEEREWLTAAENPLTPDAEWLKAHGFHLHEPTGHWYRNWDIMSFHRYDSHCLRLIPGQEGVEIMDHNGSAAHLGGCWGPHHLAMLWQAINIGPLRGD